MNESVTAGVGHAAEVSHVQPRPAYHRMIGATRRFGRTALVSIVGIASASLSLVGGAPAASAQPAPPTANVYLRIEGAASTIFEGWVTTTPHDVSTAMG